MKEKFRLNRLERSWVLYDIGNSAFTLLLATLLPIYFDTLAASAGVSEDMYLSYWGYAGSIATALVAIIGPVCGTMADQKGFKKPFFLASVLLGVLGCAALGLTQNWLLFLGIVIIGKVGFNASLVFYDSMLPEITTDKRMDNVSTRGYAYGYIGSVIPFVACLVPYILCNAMGITEQTALIIGFVITAVWWAVFTIPITKRYRQTAYVPKRKHVVVDTFRQLWNTLKKARKEKHIFLYLLAFFFFINGVYTIIDMATAYGTALGLNSVGLLLALLVTQIVAFPCAIIFGKLAQNRDSGKLIKICIVCYTGITLFAVFLVAQWQFWLLAVMVGMFQGAIQALSRSYLGKIIPADQSGEYYGLMDICGKGASVLGMGLVALVNQLVGERALRFNIQLLNGEKILTLLNLELKSANIAVASLVVLFIIGFLLFCKADKLSKERLCV